jgi:hypothetical protein
VFDIPPSLFMAIASVSWASLLIERGTWPVEGRRFGRRLDPSSGTGSPEQTRKAPEVAMPGLFAAGRTGKSSIVIYNRMLQR